ncbi:MAG: cob(I)yrinic acid a,c-diamide adenosyltransferase [Oscillospiraceae bacterium]|nr:cob(I)yrinic acid a,c-diamide adenosyltransferase [Oscillospiraceae bacterium]
MDKGLVHLYCGDGKGKTTAAMGLALRALGQGMRVVVVQFLKNGTSGELEPLKKLGAAVYSGQPGAKFTFQMNAEEKAQATKENNARLAEALQQPCDLLILDEICAARNSGMVDEALAKQAVLERPQHREVVLTGRNPEAWMVEAADYITEMQPRRHPYEQGIPARKGIEF